jgi:tetratricopeptide (TPR) repeat protein
METTNPENKPRHWSQGVRPFLWWLALVLVLFAVRTHQRLSEQTHLSFSPMLQGQPVTYDVTAMLDKQPITSGTQVSIGRHQLTITHPKAEPFSTNLFVWYGEHNLGEIVLNRSKGILVIQASPPAERIIISGDEFALTLTNSPGMTSSVPTDRYVVEANYPHWRQSQEIAVYPNASGTGNFIPRLGTVDMTCNQSDASFQLLKTDGQLIEAGELPSTMRDMPEGNYKVIAWHHRNQRERMLTVKAGMTNSLEVQFLYGAAVLETEPPGAMVTSSDGREWGYTPLRLAELPIGHWQFNLTRDGYERVSLLFEVLAQETNTFSTNLLSINYARSLNAARQYLTAANYNEALIAATSALQVKPNDPEALILQKEALGKRSLRQAESLGKQGDYIAGAKELESALQALPGNEEIKQLLSDFKQREPEQIERQRKERAERPKKVYGIIVGRYTYGDLFDDHELKTTKSFKEVQKAILDALTIQPAFQVTANDSPMPETFAIEATQETTTFLGTSAGRRQCIIVGGQTRDDETEIHFKILEFKTEAVNKFSIGALIHTPGAVNYVPVHPSGGGVLTEKLQAQLNEGISNVTARIQQAIGRGSSEKQ